MKKKNTVSCKSRTRFAKSEIGSYSESVSECENIRYETSSENGLWRKPNIHEFKKRKGKEGGIRS